MQTKTTMEDAEELSSQKDDMIPHPFARAETEVLVLKETEPRYIPFLPYATQEINPTETGILY